MMRDLAENLKFILKNNEGVNKKRFYFNCIKAVQRKLINS